MIEIDETLKLRNHKKNLKNNIYINSTYKTTWLVKTKNQSTS